MDTENALSPAIRPAAPPRVPWGWREMLAAIAFAAVGILLLNLALVWLSLRLHVRIQDDNSITAVVITVEDLIIVTAAWLFGLRRYHVGWQKVGLRRFSVPFGCGLAISLFIASYLARFVYGLVAVALGVRIEQQQILSRLDMTGWGFIGTLVAAGLIAPVAEELFFRGFLFGGLRGRIGVVGGMLASTVFFTALHLSLPLFVPIFILGLFLAMLYEHTGSLYPGIFLHAANNILDLILLYVFQSTGLLPK